MGRFLNPGNEAFMTTLKSEIYIDKSDLLSYTNKVIGTNQAFICNSRPRRFAMFARQLYTNHYKPVVNSDIKETYRLENL